jgi:hypothetical protein
MSFAGAGKFLDRAGYSRISQALIGVPASLR